MLLTHLLTGTASGAVAGCMAALSGAPGATVTGLVLAGCNLGTAASALATALSVPPGRPLTTR